MACAYFLPQTATREGGRLVKRHSSTEIEQKLATASSLATTGASQQAICLQLGISVMTLHRWRKGFRAAVKSEDAEAMWQENKRLRNIAANILLATQVLRERYLDALGRQKVIESTRPRSPSRRREQSSEVAGLETASG
jgi:hypothetical protein